jgi:hypothetical protein
LKRIFLKDIFSRLNLAYNNLKHIDFLEDTPFEKLIYLQIKSLNLIIKSAQLINLKESSTLDIVFFKLL